MRSVLIFAAFLVPTQVLASNTVGRIMQSADYTVIEFQKKVRESVNTIATTGSASGHLMSASVISGTVSVILAGQGFMMSRSKTIPKSWGQRLTRLALGGAFIAGTMAVGSLVVAMFESDPVATGTKTAYYRTPEGFPEFLQLTEEEQIAYATLDPKLGSLVMDFADLIREYGR